MKEKTRDNLIYLSVAGAIVAGFALYGIYAVRTTETVPDIPEPILWGILSTPGIVALILERFWAHRRRLILWMILLIVAAINLGAMVVAYSWQWNPPVLFLSTMTALWVVVIFVVTQKLLSREPSNRRSPR